MRRPGRFYLIYVGPAAAQNPFQRLCGMTVEGITHTVLFVSLKPDIDLTLCCVFVPLFPLLETKAK